MSLNEKIESDQKKKKKKKKSYFHQKMFIQKEYIKRIDVLHLIFFKEVSENQFSFSWINEMSLLMLLLFSLSM